MTTEHTKTCSSTASQHAVGSQVDRGVRPRAWVAMAYGMPAQATTDEPTAIRWRKAGGDVRDMHEAPSAEELAWALAEEAGEDPGTLIWEGNPPEPWGEVWCRYMPQAERLLKALYSCGPNARVQPLP